MSKEIEIGITVDGVYLKVSGYYYPEEPSQMYDNNNGTVSVLSTIIVRNNCTQLTKTVSGISGVVGTGTYWCN